MRIAVCVAGCLRGYKKVFEHQTHFFQKTLPIVLGQDLEIDWFYFIWNFNSISPCYTQMASGERNELFTELTIPVSRGQILYYKNLCLRERKGYQEFKVGTIAESFKARNDYRMWNHADGSQQYGKMKVSQMRKEYEDRNNFTYDMVFGMRFDLGFRIVKEYRVKNLSDIVPEPGKVKSVHFGRTQEMSDIFYWARSEEFTLMENMYNFVIGGGEEGKEYCDKVGGCFPEYRKKLYVEEYCNLVPESNGYIFEDGDIAHNNVYLELEFMEDLWKKINTSYKI